MSVLVIAEHNGKALSANFAKTIGAAKQLGEAVVVVAGKGIEAIAKKVATFDGVAKVITIDSPEFERPTPELWVENLAPLAADASHILAATGTYSRGFLGRLAARLQAPMVADVMAIADKTHFTRPIYAGAVLAEVAVEAEKILLSVRASSFEPAPENNNAPLEAVTAQPAKVASKSIKLDAASSDRPELGSASVVVSGGRGVGKKEDFALIEKLADKLGGAVGASRAAVDAGFAPNDWQVGQTGKVVAPDVYFAIGISGAVQHLAGIKGAKTIVAINKDPNAPIFNVADYGLVGDLFEIVPALTEKLT